MRSEREGGLTERPRLLLVEDHDDTRQFLGVALDAAGWEVVETPTAEDALAHLAAERFDVVLTDYDLTGHTGAWLVQAAQERGVLGDAAVLVITAHPEPAGLDGMPVLQKPLEMDHVLRQVERLLPARATGAAPPDRRVHLVLYVSPASASSQRARRNLEKLLARFDPAGIEYTTADLTEQPQRAERDRVIFTPTLVKSWPEPRMWFLGDLRETEPLADMLRLCGLEERR